MLLTDLASGDKVKELTSNWQLRWSKYGKGLVTYEYVKGLSARGDSVLDFGLDMGFLLTGHGRSKDFLFSRSLALSQGCVLCGADSKDWFHDLSVCSAYCDICNLNDLGGCFKALMDT